MINTSPKHIALNILIKHKYSALNKYADLQHIIESNQFTIIEYKKHANSEPVAELIQKLGIENEIEQNNSFIYIKNSLKFVFLYADVSVEDKCALLRHELGHICDPNFNNGDMHYSGIKKEEFANTFAFYVKNPGTIFKLKLLIIKKWKLSVCITVLTSCICGLFFTLNSFTLTPAQPVSRNISTTEISGSTYYVTSSGKKYHRKHCIIVKYKNNLTEMTLHEAAAAGYKPCLICNPE